MRLDSLRTRMIGVGLLFIIGTSVLMGFVTNRLTTNFLSIRFHENFRLLSSYLAKNAELGVLLNDKAMLEQLGRNMLEQKDVQAVKIVTESGLVLVDLQNDLLDKYNTEHVESPIETLKMGNESMFLTDINQYEEMGKVILTYSKNELDHLKKSLAKRFILISLILSTIPVVIYWFLAKSIVAPLNDILEVSKAVTGGSMEVRARGGHLQETRTLAKAFNEMLSALAKQREQLEYVHAEMSRQQTLAEVGKFSMMVAHEIKNPLAIIKGSIDILKKDTSDLETKKIMLHYLGDETNRINRLIEDFLQFAKPKKPHFVEIDANTLVLDLSSKLDLFHIADSGRLKIKTENAPCVLPLDPYLMERAMLNIVRNALEISGKDGVVIIETETDAETWKMRIKDSGPGIKPTDLPRIFEPFFTTKAKGTGLGLAMTKDIVESHHGEIKVWNQDNGGACFEINLPVVSLPPIMERENQMQYA